MYKSGKDQAFSDFVKKRGNMKIDHVHINRSISKFLENSVNMGNRLNKQAQKRLSRMINIDLKNKW